MSKPNAINLLASAVALGLLVALDSLVAWFAVPGDAFWTKAIPAYLVTVPFAIATWCGAFYKGARELDPNAWRDWVGAFFAGLVFSLFFLYIDRDRDPGFSGVFTITAIIMMLVALPSALRAGLMQWLSSRQFDRTRDIPPSHSA